jgi:hypothetical protein
MEKLMIAQNHSKSARPSKRALAAASGLAIPGGPMVKISYTLGVYTRSGLCPLFLFLGPESGWMRP